VNPFIERNDLPGLVREGLIRFDRSLRQCRKQQQDDDGQLQMGTVSYHKELVVTASLLFLVALSLLCLLYLLIALSLKMRARLSSSKQRIHIQLPEYGSCDAEESQAIFSMEDHNC
jgi:hypothetical protein